MVGVNGSDDDVEEPRSGQELVQARPGPFVGLSDRLPGCLSDAAILLFFLREYSRLWKVDQFKKSSDLSIGGAQRCFYIFDSIIDPTKPILLLSFQLL